MRQPIFRTPVSSAELTGDRHGVACLVVKHDGRYWRHQDWAVCGIRCSRSNTCQHSAGELSSWLCSCMAGRADKLGRLATLSRVAQQKSSIMPSCHAVPPRGGQLSSPAQWLYNSEPLLNICNACICLTKLNMYQKHIFKRSKIAYKND
jgi:hypothetical protein